MNYAPFIRIALRYLLGGGAYASLANDSDVVAVGCIISAAAVESVYLYAKRKDWTL